MKYLLIIAILALVGCQKSESSIAWKQYCGQSDLAYKQAYFEIIDGPQAQADKIYEEFLDALTSGKSEEEVFALMQKHDKAEFTVEQLFDAMTKRHDELMAPWEYLRK